MTQDGFAETHVNIGTEPSPIEVWGSPVVSPGASPSADGVYIGGAGEASLRSSCRG